ncbi:hypothetical protein L218DRAFT_713760 [Marasmius fiardii PR-910]|nr:hypothetical protein L218DRAFT_713760 [Marasmius fiardii PR-910]
MGLGLSTSSAFTTVSLLALTTVTLGSVLRVSCYRMFRGRFGFELGPMRSLGPIMDGPYSFVRHPSYSAVWICSVGLLSYRIPIPRPWIQESGASNVILTTFVVVRFVSLGAELLLGTVRGGKGNELTREGMGYVEREKENVAFCSARSFECDKIGMT